MCRQFNIIPVIFGIAALIISACSANGGGSGSTEPASTSNEETEKAVPIEYRYSGNTEADFILGKWQETCCAIAQDRYVINEFSAKDGEFYKYYGKTAGRNRDSLLEEEKNFDSLSIDEHSLLTVIYNTNHKRFLVISCNSYRIYTHYFGKAWYAKLSYETGGGYLPAEQILFGCWDTESTRTFDVDRGYIDTELYTLLKDNGTTEVTELEKKIYNEYYQKYTTSLSYWTGVYIGPQQPNGNSDTYGCWEGRLQLTQRWLRRN